eukprot:scaffold240768_cov15-Prasinocladus_malaysianus.AAC.2
MFSPTGILKSMSTSPSRSRWAVSMVEIACVGGRCGRNGGCQVKRWSRQQPEASIRSGKGDHALKRGGLCCCGSLQQQDWRPAASASITEGRTVARPGTWQPKGRSSPPTQYSLSCQSQAIGTVVASC